MCVVGGPPRPHMGHHPAPPLGVSIPALRNPSITASVTARASAPPRRILLVEEEAEPVRGAVGVGPARPRLGPRDEGVPRQPAEGPTRCALAWLGAHKRTVRTMVLAVKRARDSPPGGYVWHVR